MEGFSLNPLKAIIIDDCLIMKEMLRDILEDSFVVTAFENGQEALNYLQNGNIPDIIISDLHMPKLDGFELLTNLKASSSLNTIPIIILSAEENSAVKIKCLDAGAEDYIVKPFNPIELKARANLILKHCGKNITKVPLYCAT